MRADEIMTRDVVTVPPTAALAEAARLLLDKGIGGLPVVDDGGRVVGIVTKTDLTAASLEKSLAILLAPRAEDLFPDVTADEIGALLGKSDQSVGDVMTHDPLSAPPETPVHELANLMRRRRVHRILIVEDGRLQGIVSALDMLKYFETPTA